MRSDPPSADAARPLLEWLLGKYPDTPRSRGKQWIQAGRVSVNGVVCRKPHERMADPGGALVLGDRNATTLACGKGWQIHPRVSLLHLDSSLAIVNNGPGLIAVPAANAPLSALSILADFLSGDLKAQDRGTAGKSLPSSYRHLEPLPVHRLDQYTSGVFCIAMSTPAREKLIEQLKVHTMSREYVAFVEGRPSARSGTWRHWLKLTRDELRQQVVAEGQSRAPDPEAQEAITHYEVMAEYPRGQGKFVTKLRLRLETGRKHQIRVQAAHSGLPLVGDRAYNPSCRDGVAIDPALDFPRQALHAEVLSLDHPDSGMRMSWTAEMPKDLRQLEHALRAASR